MGSPFLPSILWFLTTDLSSSDLTAGAFTCLLAPLASFIINLKCPLLHVCSTQSRDGASGGTQGNCFSQPRQSRAAIDSSELLTTSYGHLFTAKIPA